jgi:hypothetical protein
MKATVPNLVAPQPQQITEPQPDSIPEQQPAGEEEGGRTAAL